MSVIDPFGYAARRFARQLRIPYVQAVGHIHLLGDYCLRLGRLTGLEELDLFVGCEWPTFDQEVIDALIHCGYVIASDDGYEVTGWFHYDPRREQMDRERGRMTASLRRAVIDRDGSVCRACGDVTDAPHVDHITPLARGGKTVVENLQVLCEFHNLSKGAR